MSGVVYTDLRASGGYNAAADVLLPGRTVFADLNSNNTLDSGEPSTVSNSSGSYTLNNSAAVPIRTVSPAGWISTGTTSNASSSQSTTINLGEFQLMSITGTIYADNNANGNQDQGETGLGGEIIYQDVSGTGSYKSGDPFTTSLSDGSYLLSGIGPQGIYSPSINFGTLPGYHTEGGGVGLGLYSGDQITINTGLANQSYVSGYFLVELGNNYTSSLSAPATVYADLNHDGVFNSGEVSAVTNSSGFYQFGGLPTGSVTITMIPPAGYKAYGSASQTITVGNLTASSAWFQVVQDTAVTGSITGNVYLDRNVDGFYTSSIDAPLAGQTVYVDTNQNGVFDSGDVSGITNADGGFTIAKAPVGNDLVRLLSNPTGRYAVTFPTGGLRVVTVNANQNTNVSGPAFIVKDTTAVISITGAVYNDINGDGVIESGETPVSGVTVYIDSNNDGIFQTGEQYAITNSSGGYAITESLPGSYYLREVVPQGDYQTLPSAGLGAYAIAPTLVGLSYTGENFAVAALASAAPVIVSGTVYTDAGGNGQYSIYNKGIAGRTVFADVNKNGLFDAGEPSTTTGNSGTYTFSVPVSTTIRTVIPANWVGTTGPLTAPATGSLSGANFGEFEDMTATGILYVDANADGHRDNNESPIANQSISLDLNQNGLHDAGEPTTVTDANGLFTFSGLGPRTVSYSIKYPAVAGYTPEITTSGFGNYSGETYDMSMGYTNQRYVSATVYLQVGGGYTSQAGITVFADLNNNGLLDLGEPSGISSGNGTCQFGVGNFTGAYAVDVLLPPNFTLFSGSMSVTIPSVATSGGSASFVLSTSTPLSNGAISAKVWLDLNSDRTFNPLEFPAANITVYIDTNNNGQLDSGEPATLTDAAGQYQFTGLSVGTYWVRPILPVGMALTTGAILPIAMQTYTYNGYTSVGGYQGYDFGLAPLPGAISGLVFDDINLNGVQDSGETLSATQQAYIDANNNGVYDTGDTLAVYSAGGFTFNNLTAGSYLIRSLPASGYEQTSPVNNGGTWVSVTSGQISTVSFGTGKPAPIASAGGSYTVIEGGSVPLNGSGSSEISGQIVKYEWDLNYDGASFDTDAIGVSPDFSAVGLDGPSTYTVALRVTDLLGNTNIATQSVAITNTPPTAVLSGSVVVLGSAAIVTFTAATDPSPIDKAAGFTYSYDFDNDGVYDLESSSPVATVPASYLTMLGSHTISGKIADKDGGSTVYTATVQVNPPAAVITKLSGTIIGTSGSYQNKGTTIAKAFDGNLATYYDGASANGNWLGLDLGAGYVVTSVAYVSRSGSGLPARMNGGIFQGSNSATFASGVVNLYTIASNANPSSTAFTTQKVTNTTSFRYVRYLSPNGSYGDVAELQFYGKPATVVTPTTGSVSGTVSGPLSATVYLDANNNGTLDNGELSTTATGSYSFSNVPVGSYVVRQVVPAGYTQTAPASGYSISIIAGSSFTGENFVDTANSGSLSKLTGTAIGTSGSYQNTGNTIAKALDDSLTTFFDGPTANGNWVGIDLGSAKTVKKISFAPRSGLGSRMVGGIFQASNSATFSSGVVNLFTIGTAPAANVLTSVSVNVTSTYRYYRYLSPNGSYGDVAEIAFFG